MCSIQYALVRDVIAEFEQLLSIKPFQSEECALETEIEKNCTSSNAMCYVKYLIIIR